MTSWIKISDRARKWWVLAAMASCISMIFRIGDMYGHRKIFSIGMITFAVSSALCGMSESGSWFIAARFLQGIGGALIIPTAPSMLAPAFPADQQGKAFGYYVSIGAFFLSLGPIVGGFFTQFLSWRYVFWINIPIAAIGLFLTFLSVPKSAKRDESFDFLGFITIAIGVSCIVVGLMQGSDWGWTYWLVPTLIICGIFLILALALFDREVKDPFLDFRLFREKSYVAANSVVFATQMMLMVSIFWSIYFQTVLGYSPSVAGFYSMLSNCPVILFSHFACRLSDRFGPKLPIVIGFCLAIFGVSWFIAVPTPPSPLLLLPFIVPFGCGIPLILLPSFMLIMSRVPPHKRGIAVGINMTIRQFGATLGMAVFGQVFLSLQNHWFGIKLQGDPMTEGLDPRTFEGLLAHADPAIQAMNALPEPIAKKVYDGFLSTYISSSTAINYLSLAFAVCGLICVIFLIKWGKSKPIQSSSPPSK